MLYTLAKHKRGNTPVIIKKLFIGRCAIREISGVPYDGVQSIVIKERMFSNARDAAANNDRSQVTTREGFIIDSYNAVGNSD